MDLDRDEIVFAPGTHQFQTGDLVYYFTQGETPVGGLVSGTRYRVFVVDEQRIKLQALAGATPSVNVGLGSIDLDDDVINVANSFQNGDAVTYRAPAPYEFSSAGVDIDVDDKGNFDPGDDEATIDDNNQIYLNNHGLSDGEFLLRTV